MTARRWALAGAVFLSIVYVSWAILFIYRTSIIAADGQRYFSLADDAMISMRYAWNLSHGEGLVWNAGERVEGYTNLLMVLVMASCTAIFDKVGAVLAVQLSGIPVMLVIAILALLHWKELARGNDVHYRDGVAALAFLGTLLYHPLSYWTLMGMETGLLTLFLLAGSLLLLIYLRRGGYLPLVASALAFGVGYLARPDSAAVAGAMLIGGTLLGAGTLRGRLQALVISLVAYLVLPLVQEVFRVGYYGELAPLTYTLKMTGMPLEIRLDDGLTFVRGFLPQSRLAYFVALLGVTLGFSRRKLVLLLPPIALLVSQVLVGGDPWPRWRILAPGVPYLVILVLGSADWLIAQMASINSARRRNHRAGVSLQLDLAERRGPLALGLVGALMIIGGFMGDALGGSPGIGIAQRYVLVAGVVALFLATTAEGHLGRMLAALPVLILVFIPLARPFVEEAILWSVPYQVEENRERVDVAVAINRWTTPAASIGVVSAGTIPYYTSRYAIDFLGKNDPYIAHLAADVSGKISWGGLTSVPGHNKYDLNYSIVERRPTYVQIFRWGSQDLTQVFESDYTEVDLPGLNVVFRRGDPAVLWDKIPPERILP